MTVSIEPASIAVHHLQPNDILFVNDEAMDLTEIRGDFPCPIIPVRVRPGMTVADELAIIRNEAT